MKENYVFMRGGAYARVKGRKALVVVFFLSAAVGVFSDSAASDLRPRGNTLEEPGFLPKT
jgi:hypothetical protein